MKGLVGLVGWPIADGLPTEVVTRQLQVKRRTGKVRRLKTAVSAYSLNLRRRQTSTQFSDYLLDGHKTRRDMYRLLCCSLKLPRASFRTTSGRPCLNRSKKLSKNLRRSCRPACFHNSSRTLPASGLSIIVFSCIICTVIPVIRSLIL